MMKQKLEDIFRLFQMTEDDIANGLSYFKPVSLKKNDALIESGKVCNWIGFVNTGVLRNYYISSKAEEVTYCLTFPDKFLTAYSSFISNEPTFENIHAITDAEILMIHKSQYLQLIESSKNWFTFSKVFAEQSYIMMENRLIALQMESAEKRYEDLINNYPDYLQQVPLKYLASYLGITPRHLSRLRKNITF